MERWPKISGDIAKIGYKIAGKVALF